MVQPVTLKKRFTSAQVIVFSFALTILIGALLLMLPISSKDGVVTPFSDTLFTAASAVCVTGLVVHDTASYWSYFGQAIILIMIQIGGMGVVTMATAITLVSGRRISLAARSTMQDSISAPAVGGIVRLTGFIIKTSAVIELAGAAIMMPVFIGDYGARGIWMAFFHSISAFCNAGFDLMGTAEAPYVSLTAYAGNPVISITVCALIITGGIGFLTWDDFRSHGFHFRKFRMQTRVILTVTAILIVLPTIYNYIFEYGSLSGGERFLASLFQAVTPRTAGFNTTDLTAMNGAGRGIIVILMLIGGSPGSTAGGMKTTTIAVLLANSAAVFRRKKSTTLFRRSLEPEVIRNASTIEIMYVTLCLLAAIALASLEGKPFTSCIFETASAVGTVGLTLGLTPSLHLVSRLILIFLMFFGRVGGLTLIYAAQTHEPNNAGRMPVERITVG